MSGKEISRIAHKVEITALVLLLLWGIFWGITQGRLTLQQLSPIEVTTTAPKHNTTLEHLRYASANWTNMTRDERLDVCRDVVDFCTEKLGLPNVPLVVCRAFLLGEGEYEHQKEPIIYIRKEALEKRSFQNCAFIICHECFHAFEHAEVDIWEALPEQYKNLATFSAASVWADEFQNYTIGPGYESQEVEIAANAFAKSLVAELVALLCEMPPLTLSYNCKLMQTH